MVLALPPLIIVVTMNKVRMKSYFYVLCILGMMAETMAVDETPANLMVEVFNFDNCHTDSPEGFSMSFENISMRMDINTKQLFVTGRLNMKIAWTEDMGGHLTLSKCLDKDDINSCTKYFENGVNDLCRHLPEKDQDWAPFIDKIKGFVPQCPVEAGTYTVNEAPISTGKLDNMKSALGIWHLAFSMWKGDTKVLCTDSGVEIKRARRSKKKKGSAVPL